MARFRRTPDLTPDEVALCAFYVSGGGLLEPATSAPEVAPDPQSPRFEAFETTDQFVAARAHRSTAPAESIETVHAHVRVRRPAQFN